MSQGRITGEVPQARATQEELMRYMTMEERPGAAQQQSAGPAEEGTVR